MTTYFKKFPTIEYTLNGRSKLVTNILASVLPKRLNVDKTYVFQRYLVSSGERPEETAERMYKDPNLYWVILLINNITDPLLGWKMSDSELDLYCEAKYDNINEVHHYFNIEKNKISDEVDEKYFRTLPNSQLPVNIKPVTNFDYESELNNEKGQIIVVNPKYVSQFVESVIRALEGK